MSNLDNRCTVTAGHWDATIVRYPGRTQAGLLDFVVEHGAAFGPYALHFQEGVDDVESIDYDLTGATMALVIDTATPLTLAITTGITLDADPTTGKCTFALTATQADTLIAPRTRYMLTVTKSAVTRRWLEGVMVSSPKVSAT